VDLKADDIDEYEEVRCCFLAALLLAIFWSDLTFPHSLTRGRLRAAFLVNINYFGCHYYFWENS